MMSFQPKNELNIEGFIKKEVPIIHGEMAQAIKKITNIMDILFTYGTGLLFLLGIFLLLVLFS
jgi:hypothetical protein